MVLRIRCMTLLILGLCLARPDSCHAEPPPLYLGQSAVLSGPAQNLGLEMRAGLLAAFSLINDQGGIKGREVVLISRDDGYEPHIYTVERNGLKKLVYQTPWYENGAYRGFVELILPLPAELPHIVRG